MGKFFTLQVVMFLVIGYAICTFYPQGGQMVRAKLGV